MSRRDRRRLLATVATRLEDALDDVEAAAARQAAAVTKLTQEISGRDR